MARLNYLAIMCDDPARMRDWYQRWLGFEEINHTPEGTIYITDGHCSVGLLQRGSAPGEDSQDEVGVHHLGFQIDSILDIERNLEEFDPSIRIERRPSADPYAEYRLRDPEGVIVDLSERGYGVEGDQQRVPGIRHLALCNQDQPRKHAFYLQVFGMHDVTRTPEEIEEQTRITFGGQIPADFKPITVPSPFGGDGFVNLAILKQTASTSGRGRNRPSWLDHFGMLVPDPLGLLTQIRAAEPTDEPLDVRPPERQVEYGVKDPEGNRIDLSNKGWKVAPNQWARI